MKYWIELSGYDESGAQVTEKLSVDAYPDMVTASQQMKLAGLNELPYWTHKRKKDPPIQAGIFHALAL